MKARSSISTILLLSTLNICILAGIAFSQQDEVAKYPHRPVTYIQPFTAGVQADLAIRLISKKAESFLGQPIVILNKPGAGGSIGVAAVAKAKPDGYTIGNTPHSPMFVAPFLEDLPYHPLKDFKMIMQFAGFTVAAIVKPDSPLKSFKDVIAYARQNPKKLTYGTSGTNSMQFLIMEQIANKEKVQFTHIPFKSMVEAEAALLGGHILLAAGPFTYSLLEGNQIRPILLLMEEHPAEYQQVPILKDLGYDFPTPLPICVAGPRGIPDGIVKKLEDAYTKAAKSPEFIKGMKDDLHLSIVYRNSQDLETYVAHNYRVFEKLLKDMGITK